MSLAKHESTLDVARFEALRRSRGTVFGTPLLAVSATTSTNDDAMDAAHRGLPAGATFVADSQTRGRGRRGSRWTSPPGENLTFSVLLRPAIAIERASQLTLVAGAALRAAVAALVDAPVAIKWPNDVVVERRKLAGILVESKITGGRLDAVVIGVGVNVAMTSLPLSISGVATSLSLLGAREATRESVLSDVLHELERRIDAFERRGLASCLPEIRAHDALLGQAIRVDGREGTGAGIDPDGALLLDDASGTIHVVTSGHVDRF